MRWQLVTWLTVKATDLSNVLLSSRDWHYNLKDFSKFPKNSLGYCLYDYLQSKNIPFKPNLIRHDIKHVLLNYEMEMPDELKIHAFLIGNRSYNLMGIIYLSICTIIVPEVLPKLITEYKRGRQATCLKNTDLQNHIYQDIQEVRQLLVIK